MKQIQCKNCNNSFLALQIIDGKPRNLYKRKYCFNCSPLGNHNTKTLETQELFDNAKRCADCGEVKSLDNFYNRGGKRNGELGSYCKECLNHNTKEKQHKLGNERKLQAIKNRGGKCSNCSYNKNMAALHFHHINPSTKLFDLNKRTFANLKKEKLQEELKKCILLCANCHTEHHNPQLDMSIIGIEPISHAL